MGVIHYAQVVDGSTRQQHGRDGLVSTAMGDWLAHGRQTSVEIQTSDLQKRSKNEVPRIGFAGCGKCSHTPWEYFARTTGLPAAKYGKNQNFAGFWG